MLKNVAKSLNAIQSSYMYKSLIVLTYQHWQLTLVKSDYKKFSFFLRHSIDLINVIKAHLSL